MAENKSKETDCERERAKWLQTDASDSRFLLKICFFLQRHPSNLLMTCTSAFSIRPKQTKTPETTVALHMSSVHICINSGMRFYVLSEDPPRTIETFKLLRAVRIKMIEQR